VHSAKARIGKEPPRVKVGLPLVASATSEVSPDIATGAGSQTSVKAECKKRVPRGVWESRVRSAALCHHGTGTGSVIECGWWCQWVGAPNSDYNCHPVANFTAAIAACRYCRSFNAFSTGCFAITGRGETICGKHSCIAVLC
jgi:hypothetical protein